MMRYAMPVLAIGCMAVLSGCPGDTALAGAWTAEYTERTIEYTFTAFQARRITTFHGSTEANSITVKETGFYAADTSATPPAIDWTIRLVQVDSDEVRAWFESAYSSQPEEELAALYAAYDVEDFDNLIQLLSRTFRDDLLAQQGESFTGVYAVEGDMLYLDMAPAPDRPLNLGAAMSFARSE